MMPLRIHHARKPAFPFPRFPPPLKERRGGKRRGEKKSSEAPRVFEQGAKRIEEKRGNGSVRCNKWTLTALPLIASSITYGNIPYIHTAMHAHDNRHHAFYLLCSERTACVSTEGRGSAVLQPTERESLVLDFLSFLLLLVSAKVTAAPPPAGGEGMPAQSVRWKRRGMEWPGRKETTTICRERKEASFGSSDWLVWTRPEGGVAAWSHFQGEGGEEEEVDHAHSISPSLPRDHHHHTRDFFCFPLGLLPLLSRPSVGLGFLSVLGDKKKEGVFPPPPFSWVGGRKKRTEAGRPDQARKRRGERPSPAILGRRRRKG